jgi:hypothetical protein
LRRRLSFGRRCRATSKHAFARYSGKVATYVSPHGHAFIDRALYLPKALTDDPAGMTAAYVPDGTGFATKPDLAITMIERAIAADVPFAWVAADSVYGVGAVETEIARELEASSWQRLSAGDGTKGPRLYDFGHIANWLISMPLNTMTSARVCGHVAC